MKLQFLGQTLGLVKGHVYQARWLVSGSGYSFPCPVSDARVTQVRDILGALGSIVTPGYGSVPPWETPAVLKVPNAQIFDQLKWPTDRREVPPNAYPGSSTLCPIWTSSVPTQDMNISLETIQNALAPFNGILLNLWDNTTGQRIYDRPRAALAPPLGPTSPGQPPISIIPPGGTTSPGQPPVITTPPPPTAVEKKTSPVVYVVIGALAIGVIALVVR